MLDLEGSSCSKAQGLDHNVEVKNRLNSNTAPQFGTLLYHTAKTKVTVESAVQQELSAKEVVSTIMLSLLLLS